MARASPASSAVRRFSRHLPLVVLFLLFASPARATTQAGLDNNNVRDNSVTAPDNSVTAPDNSVTAPDNSVTAPDNSVTAPDNLIRQGNNVIRQGNNVTAPDNNVTVTGNSVSGGASGGAEGGAAAAAEEEDPYLEETPEVRQLVERLERIAGSIKNPWEVLLHLDQLFAHNATAAGARVSPLASGECGATKAEMRKEVSRLAFNLKFRPIKYTIMGRFFRNLARSARKKDADLSYLGCRTYLIPSNFAIMNVIAKGASDFKYLLLAPLYNIINGTYHFKRLMGMPHSTTMPTLIPGWPIAKYFTPVTPLALITFGGTFVAVGTPGAKTIFARLGWAQIKDPDMYWGKYLAAHGVSTMVIPRFKIKT
ncbi:hypothetical protein CLOM_g16985 [Closterium sp. NIES-68]|nr:hypothetical protein CLOM_g16985 [Closterium sp. NIES-68]GJP62764.1 hypothetical protein CLOP_g19791 [Closterium sp. NIES-67]